MTWNKIAGELAAAANIVGQWKDAENVSAIDREMVMERLRRVYEQMWTLEHVAAEPAVPEAAPAPRVASEPEAEGVALKAAPEVVASEPEAANEKVVAEKAVPEAAPAPRVAPEPEAEGVALKAAPEVVVSESEAANEKIAADHPLGEELAEMIKSDKLLGDDMPLRPKRDRKALLSLYGDESASPVAPVAPQAEEPAFELQPDIVEATQNVSAPEPGNSVDDVLQVMEFGLVEEREIPVNKAQKTESHYAVLGETIAHGETIGDAYAQMGGGDVASRIAGGRISGLRGAIGINDKFLMIRDLFAGDGQAYEKAIDALDAFDDLDEAMLYIHETYSWNPDSAGVTLIVDLLTRKLS